jgi:hypothetical protein
MNFGFENNKFYVDIPPCKRAPGTMRKESDRRALEIAEAGSKLMLCMSSGVDSQAVLHSFYEQGIPIECVYFYMPGHNDVEYAQLKEVENMALFCLPEMIPFYQRWGFTNEVVKLELMYRYQ